MKLRRYEGNPILKPKPENAWESKNVFNPARARESVQDAGILLLKGRPS